MLGKRGDATTLSLKEVTELVLRLIVVIFVLALLAGIVSMLTRNRAVDNANLDLDRVVIELSDLRQGEILTVPILSNGYVLNIITAEDVKSTGIVCDIENKNYCACIKKTTDMVACSGFKAGEGNKNFQILANSKGVNLESAKGITLKYEGDNIFVS